MRRRPGSRLSILYELYAATQAARTLVAAAMVGSPLTPEEYAVYSILFDEGPHAPSELAARAGMPPTSMSHFVRRMLERGHAERATSDEDRRSYRIVLTDAGLAAHAVASRLFAGADNRFVRELPLDEEEAGAMLRAIGQAAATAEARLDTDTTEASA